MKPQGLGKERDEILNAALLAALAPIADAALALGASGEAAKVLMVETFAHAAGLLLLAHTGRMVLLALTLLVGVITLGTGRTTVLQGIVHLVIFATFLFLTVVP